MIWCAAEPLEYGAKCDYWGRQLHNWRVGWGFRAAGDQLNADAHTLFKLPKANAALEGTKSVVARGVIDPVALKKETVTGIELLSVTHKQGLNDISEIETCALEPNGTFYVEAKMSSLDQRHFDALQETSTAMRDEMKALRAEIAIR